MDTSIHVRADRRATGSTRASARRTPPAAASSQPSGPRKDREGLTRGRLLRFGAIIAAMIIATMAISLWALGSTAEQVSTTSATARAVSAIDKLVLDTFAVNRSRVLHSLALYSGDDALADRQAAEGAERLISFRRDLKAVVDAVTAVPNDGLSGDDATAIGAAGRAGTAVIALHDVGASWAKYADSFASESALVLTTDTFDTTMQRFDALVAAEQAIAVPLAHLQSAVQDASDAATTRNRLLIAFGSAIALLAFVVIGRRVLRLVAASSQLQIEIAEAHERERAHAAETESRERLSRERELAQTREEAERKLREQQSEREREREAAARAEQDRENQRVLEQQAADRRSAEQARQRASEQETMERQALELARAEELRTKVDSLLDSVARAAAGDLTSSVEVTGTDPIGRVGEGLAKLLGDLRDSIASIAGNSEALAASAEELQVVSRQMSSNSTETSEQINLVRVASGEVSDNVETVSAGAEGMKESIREIARNAQAATEVVTQAVDAARSTTDTVRRLGESSAEIGEIIQVITGIATQTNLLALNATIEAARAGEAGKGFAVVANEVKELAKETAKASDDISTRIQAIQSDTQLSVDSITAILAIVERIAAFQHSIAAAVEEQAATSNDIARSVTDASLGSARITTNMQRVAETAESTAAGANDTQHAADTLTRMAADLQILVRRFSY